MKKLFNSDMSLNETGNQVKKQFKNSLETPFLKNCYSGIDPRDMVHIILDVATELNHYGMKYLENYFKDKKFDTDKLLIRNLQTNETKYANFRGMGSQNRRFWVFEEGWEPTVPFSIADENGKKFWWIHIDINCE